MLWTDRQQEHARNDGWVLASVVDEGKPVNTAYLDLFQHGPKFTTRNAVLAHVGEQARRGSVFHMEALAARSASRAPTKTSRKK